jgi:VCBS repeat-containing protein
MSSGAGADVASVNAYDEPTPPVAVDDAYSVVGGATLTVPAPGVLANDTDENDDALTAQVASGPSSGVLMLNSNGSFTYTPGPDTTGIVTFTYQAADATSVSNIATVTITVTAGCDGRPATIVGTSANNNLNGTGGNDVIVGLGGNDSIDAGSGNDIICGGSGNDDVANGSGNDRVFGDPGNDNLRGGSGDDLLDGGDGNDLLDGGGDRDRLLGGAGVDRLLGGGDPDVLDGGADTPDRCDGEGGSDSTPGGCEQVSSIP